MTEWPKTWRLLASFPELVDLLCEAEPKAAEAQATACPGSPEATRTALEPDPRRPRSDRADHAADARGRRVSHDRLQTGDVRTLAELTPLHSRKRRLGEPADAGPAGPQTGAPANRIGTAINWLPLAPPTVASSTPPPPPVRKK